MPDRVLVEQLRLVHANAVVSFGATLFVGLLMLWVHHPAGGRGPLLVWFGFVCACIGVAIWLARRYLHASNALASVAVTLRQTAVIYAVYGVIWGVLPWLTLDDASPHEATWQVCAFAAMLAAFAVFLALAVREPREAPVRVKE